MATLLVLSVYLLLKKIATKTKMQLIYSRKSGSCLYKMNSILC